VRSGRCGWSLGIDPTASTATHSSFIEVPSTGLQVCVWCVEDRHQSWSVVGLVAGEDEPSPPPADVARCDLLCQLGVLLSDDSSRQSTESTLSTPAMLRPAGDSVPPRVDTAASTSTVPNDHSVADSTTVTSGMLCHKITMSVYLCSSLKRGLIGASCMLYLLCFPIVNSPGMTVDPDREAESHLSRSLGADMLEYASIIHDLRVMVIIQLNLGLP